MKNSHIEPLDSDRLGSPTDNNSNLPPNNLFRQQSGGGITNFNSTNNNSTKKDELFNEMQNIVEDNF
jgi:hypothetical protein